MSGRKWVLLGLLIGAGLCARTAQGAAARKCPSLPPAPDPVDEIGEISGTASDAWAIGARHDAQGRFKSNVVVHWDGCAWQAVPTPFDERCDRLMALWANGREAWLSGVHAIVRPDDEYESYRQRDPCPEAGSRLYRRRGAGWEKVDRGATGPETTAVYELWGSGANDVWMLEWPYGAYNREGAKVRHWDGKAVVDVASPSGIQRFSALWGSGPRDVWVGGDGGVARRDGAGWTTFPMDTKYVHAIGGTAPSDVWVRAGGTNLLRRWDGSSWTEVAPSSSETSKGRGPGFNWLAGASGGHMFATDAAGNIYRSQGATLSVIGRIRAWSGIYPATAWRALVVGRDELWLFVGAKPRPPTMRWANGKWTAAAPEWDVDKREDIVSLWADATNVWAAVSFLVAPDNRAGEIRRWNGTDWERATALDQFPKRFWGVAPDDVWLVGLGGATWHWDGKLWTSVPTGTSEPLFTVWGASSRDVWAGGEAGVMFRWDGAAWRRWSMLKSSGLRVVALGGAGADFVVAAGQAAVTRWDGRGWIDGGPSEDNAFSWSGTADFRGAWGSSPTNFWLVGTGGDAGPAERYGQGYTRRVEPTPYILRWDGKSWKRNKVAGGAPLRAITGTAANDVWTVGDRGTVLRWDGKTWSSVPSGTEADLLAVAKTKDGTVWIGGVNGTLQRLVPSP